ncbi:MAG: histidine phosphatase family protein [Anaerolineales bacterium]|nr:histidine phosphatase family protein [Anaerolineales bacterium]
MTFYIIRHADKEKGDFFNPKLRHQDEPISQKGQEQAEKLVSYFADKEISKIYVSAYLRTGQTIAPVAKHFNLHPIVDERLNEIDNGLFDGASDAEIRQRFPAEWQAFRERATDFRFPAGETGEEARKRIAGFLNEKRELHEDENTVIVCHEGLIRILMCQLTNNPVYNRWDFYVDFCGITEISYQPEYGKWKLIRFNQICA